MKTSPRKIPSPDLSQSQNGVCVGQHIVNMHKNTSYEHLRQIVRAAPENPSGSERISGFGRHYCFSGRTIPVMPGIITRNKQDLPTKNTEAAARSKKIQPKKHLN